MIVGVGSLSFTREVSGVNPIEGYIALTGLLESSWRIPSFKVFLGKRRGLVGVNFPSTSNLMSLWGLLVQSSNDETFCGKVSSLMIVVFALERLEVLFGFCSFDAFEQN